MAEHYMDPDNWKSSSDPTPIAAAPDGAERHGILFPLRKVSDPHRDGTPAFRVEDVRNYLFPFVDEPTADFVLAALTACKDMDVQAIAGIPAKLAALERERDEYRAEVDGEMRRRDRCIAAQEAALAAPPAKEAADG